MDKVTFQLRNINFKYDFKYLYNFECTGGNFDISNVSKQDTVYPTTGATVAQNGRHVFCFFVFNDHDSHY